MGGSVPLSNTWFLDPNGISNGSAVFALLKIVTDQQTDDATLVCNNRPHLHSTLTQHKNHNN